MRPLLRVGVALAIVIGSVGSTLRSQTPPPAAVQPGTGVIAGRVLRADTKEPIEGAMVQLQRAAGPATVKSDARGAFRFENLPAGSVLLMATADRFFPQDAVLNRPNGFGKRYDIAEAQQITGIELLLAPASGIDGRVVDEFGDPAPGVTMMITQLMQAAGRSRLMPMGGRTVVTTDDRGVFRMPRLMPGDYYLVALSGPFGTVGGQMLATPTNSTRPGFAPTYFPGTSNAAEASAIHVVSGSDPAPVTMRLVPAVLRTVKGQVVEASDPAASATPATGGVLQLLQLHGGDVRAIVPANLAINPDGTFVYRNVPQGSYVLQARTRTGFGATRLVVADGDLNDLRVVALPPMTARGHIRFEGGGAPPQPAQVQLAVRPTDFVSGPVGGNAPPRVKINPDWSFELPGLQSTGVVISFAPPNWQLLRVTAGGTDITDRPYDFQSHDVSDLEVVLSNRWGALTASVTDEGVPAPDCTVLVYSEDPAKWTFPSRHVVIGRSNQLGVFGGSAFPAGSYLVIAVPLKTASGTEIDPVLLESLRSRATRVTLSEGTTTPVTLRLVK